MSADLLPPASPPIRRLLAGRVPARAHLPSAPVSPTRPRLRLVGYGDPFPPTLPPARGDAPRRPGLHDPADPRWVLAVRAAEELDGDILRPERREALLRLGGVLGLSRFDASLILAIVQDQARRGYAPEYCPTAGEAQLAMIPRTGRGERKARSRARMLVAWVTIAVLATELLLVMAWLGR